MIKIITLDASGAVVGNHDALDEEVTLPVILADVIHLHPDCPPLGSAGFDQWLAEWHEQHNPDGQQDTPPEI